MAACAFLDGSACGVIEMVTMLGFGGSGGAAYVAEIDMTPPNAWLVTMVSTPQLAPLHPGPEMVQERFVEGFEPAIGVRVEAMVPDPPEATADGAESCREKLLVMVTAAETCLPGSATLCAVRVTADTAGRNCGAMKLPFTSSEPHAAGQATPERLQRIAALGCPALVIAAWNCCVAPSSTPIAPGVSAMAMSLRMELVAEACLAESTTLCAVIVMVAEAGRIWGAV